MVRWAIASSAVVVLATAGMPCRADAIAGGAATLIPYTVRVNVGSARNGSDFWSCSGVEVAVGWIVTAATCLRASGAAPTTDGGAPAKTVSVAGGAPVIQTVIQAVIHPTRDVALLRVDAVAGLGEQSADLAASAPIDGETLTVAGYGRTATEWNSENQHKMAFQVRATTDTTIQGSPVDTGVLCKGDAGGPAFRAATDGSLLLVGIVSSAEQGGCRGAAATDGHDATLTRVDDLGPWIGSWTLDTGFEATDLVAATNTPAWTGSVNAVIGVCCSLAGPELGTSTERPHTGTTALMYSGKDNSATKSYAYMKAYTAPSLPVLSGTLLDYWIYPQGTSPATGSNSTCVALDLAFSDGAYLRDLKAYTNAGVDSHPAHQCGHLTLNTWNHVVVRVGQVAAGKKITQVIVGYDQPGGTGGYRGMIDDIQVYEGCLAGGGVLCASGARSFAATQGTALASNLTATESGATDPASAVEDFAYPGADQILDQSHVKLVSGNGEIELVDCDAAATGTVTYFKVRSSDLEVGDQGLFCLKVLSTRYGVINLEAPEVYSIRSDGQSTGEGHTATATWKVGTAAAQSGSVPLGGILPMGIGTSPDSDPATLLRFTANG